MQLFPLLCSHQIQLAGAEDICEQEVKVGFEPSFPFPCHLKFHINHIDQYISNLRKIDCFSYHPALEEVLLNGDDLLAADVKAGAPCKTLL